MPIFQSVYAGIVLLQLGSGAIVPQFIPPLSLSSSEASGLPVLPHSASPYSPQGVVATGIAWPPRISRGQATIPLQPASEPNLEKLYPHSSLFSATVTIGDSPHRLVIDTGASNSAFDQQLAQQMGWPSQSLPGDMSSFVVGELCPQLSLKLYQLPVLSVDQARVEGLAGLGLPFRTNPTGTAGVLGMDFLSEFDVVINPQSRQLRLHSPSAPDSDAIPLVGRLGLMIGEVSIGGADPVPFMLDTGASLTVISPRLAQQLNLDLSQAQPIKVIGFCGTEPGLHLKLDDLALGDRHVQNLDVMILDSPVLATLEVDGILGQNFLSRYQQHWRFGHPNASGFPEAGSLELDPLIP